MLQSSFFENVARKHPNYIAVDDHGKKFTYRKLNEKSNQLANLLSNIKSEKNEKICILTNKNINLYTSILGILKSGSCWVPLSNLFPVERIKFILNSTESKILIVEKEFLKTVKKISKNLNVIVIDENKKINKEKNIFNLKNINSQSKKINEITTPNSLDLAYIIYTSGSTGDPKGVMVTHLNTTTFLKNTKSYFKIPSRLRFAHTAEIIFDPSIFDLFVCWLNAGTVVPVNKKEYKVNFINYFKKNKKINVCFLVPSHFQKLKDLNNLKSKYLKNLKHVIFTGEYLSKDLVLEIFKSIPNINVYNCYGTTETAIISHWIKYTKRDLVKKSLSVGKEIPEVKTILVNKLGKLAKINEKGIALSYGIQVSPGYWNNEYLNKKYFIEDPTNQIKYQKVYNTGDVLYKDEEDLYYYCGRQDNQVKIRGHRVEIGEIENLFKFKSKCRDIVVLPYSRNKTSSYDDLIYFIRTDDINKSKNYYFSQAKKSLPAFMRPTNVILFKEDFPRNINGKIDKKKLEKIHTSSFK